MATTQFALLVAKLSRRRFLIAAGLLPASAGISSGDRHHVECSKRVSTTDHTSVTLRRTALEKLSELEMIDSSLKSPVAWSRLEKEIVLIEKLGLASDLIVAHEIVQVANSTSLRALGRELEHASLLAYVLGIVHVNPMLTGLSYEDFAYELGQTRRISLEVCSDHWDDLVEEKRIPKSLRLIPSEGLTAIGDLQLRLQHRGSFRFNADWRPSLGDRPTFEMLVRGDTEGIPFLDQPESKRALTQLRPNCFGDLVAFAALEYGWFESASLRQLVAAKNIRSVSRWPALIEDCLATTYGQLVYREQAFRIVQRLLLCDYASAVEGWHDLVNSRPGSDAFVRDRLLEASHRIGIAPEASAGLMQELIDTADDSRSQTISVLGAYLDYTLAYLKAHYPAEFAHSRIS